eukprot:scaffold26931_cov52-Cyclotella_meneghiniana.AAC.1
MFENSKKDLRCYDCGYQNPDHTSPTSNVSTKKKVKCGACGHEGHNRSTATENNCPAYYNEEEVDRREKLKQKNLAKIEEARQKIERLEREEEESNRTFEEWQAKTKEIERNNLQAKEYRNDALKREKEKKRRLEKRQG